MDSIKVATWRYARQARCRAESQGKAGCGNGIAREVEHLKAKALSKKDVQLIASMMKDDEYIYLSASESNCCHDLEFITEKDLTEYMAPVSINL